LSLKLSDTRVYTRQGAVGCVSGRERERVCVCARKMERERERWKEREREGAPEREHTFVPPPMSEGWWVESGSPGRLCPPTLHRTPCTLHPAPCTLHPAPCTLIQHPTPYTQHPRQTFVPPPMSDEWWEESGSPGRLCPLSHTHTLSLSLPLSPSLSHTHSLPLSPSLTHTLSHTFVPPPMSEEWWVESGSPGRLCPPPARARVRACP